ncbi:MAG: amidase [Casimicrobiaceae bacterium]|nr:amidase [Casimicrobiaceae bacterium]
MTELASHPSHAFVPYPWVEVPHAQTGPLAGLTFAVKDLFDVAGYPTGAGSPVVLARSGIKTTTAPTVERLLAAGARFVGKTHTDELAFSMNGKNAHFGMPINGAAPERIPGGSSSGSASAVSHGLCDFALGTDTGGSVRAPANHCGLYGIRPTHGRVSLEGVHALAPSFDTCGWFARDAITFSRVADVLLGPDPCALGTPRLLEPVDLWSLIEPAVKEALLPARKRIERAMDHQAEAVQVTASAGEFALESLYWAFRHIQGFEAWQADGELIERFAPPLGPGVAERFAWARTVTQAQCDAGWKVRRAFERHLARLLGNDGVLLMPTMPDVAPLASAPEPTLQDYRERALRLLMISGLAGFPQVTLPLAEREGAPLGLSLLGPRGSDRALVAIAERVA